MTTDRVRVWLDTPQSRDWACQVIRDAAKGSIVTVEGPRRTQPQNDRMWAMLGDISEQLVWRGHLYPPESWKQFFLHTLQGELWMPDEDGGQVPIGRSSSALTKAEMSLLMELISAFAARHGVRLYGEPPARREK